MHFTVHRQPSSQKLFEILRIRTVNAQLVLVCLLINPNTIWSDI
jgi:hypothetical protein